MELDARALGAFSDLFAVAGTRPPIEIAQGLAVLAGEEEVSHPVAVCTVTADRTTWECMALVGSSVLSLSGSRAGRDWYTSSIPGNTSPPNVYGSLTALSEVVACRLLSTQSAGSVTQRWTKWALQLRSGDSLQVPWSETSRDGQERHEALALEVAKRLRLST